MVRQEAPRLHLRRPVLCRQPEHVVHRLSPQPADDAVGDRRGSIGTMTRLPRVCAAILGLATVAASVQPVERGSLRLFYIQKPIGLERYEIVRDGDRLKLSSDFDFNDRGGSVRLAATLETTADLSPLSFRAKGK